MRQHLLLTLASMLVVAASTFAQSSAEWRSWNEPVKPLRVIGNVYYVGAKEVSSFLITTPAGHLLLDGGFAETAPLIAENVRQLGFKLEDIKLLIGSHAHSDHAGGLAELKRLTGAKLLVTAADAAMLERGGKDDFAWGDQFAFPAVKADRTLRDSEQVTLGGVTLTPRLTPGHTRGCTTWTMKVEEGGKLYDVVFVGSASVPGYKLVGNEKYPQIADDYARTFRVLKSLPCDVFLAPHGSFFALAEKARRAAQGAKQNPFIDPQGYRDYVARAERAYLEQLSRERQAAKSGGTK
jgi:metallo-beta-lactamase class B